MRELPIVLLLASAALLLPPAGCGGDADTAKGKGGGPRPPENRIRIYVGAGLREPCDQLVRAFEKEYGASVVTDYAGSEVLISRVKLARRGDVYMPGDRHYVDQAEKAGMISSQKSVCYFVPTILVPKGNPKDIKGLRDLLKPGLRLGVGDAKACAIGRKTRKIFEKNGIRWESVRKNLKFQSLTVNELGMQIQARSLDAVIVWDAVAKQYAKFGEEVPIPVSKNIISTVNAGVLSFTKNPDLAAKFVAFAAGKRGRAIFKKHHYRTEAPK
jgi:molybdate transport system substrate-binding protein